MWRRRTQDEGVYKKLSDTGQVGDGSVTNNTPEVVSNGEDGGDIVDKSKEGEEVVDGDKSIEENNGNKNDKVENDKNEQVTENNKKLMCCVCGVEENVKRCSGCKAAHYCSKECQHSHWEHHSVYCQAIVDLEHLERCKLYGSKTVRQPSGLTGRTKRRMVYLVAAP